MRFEDERYVRVFTRDTADLLDMGWEARALLWELLRKADRAGIVPIAKSGTRGLSRLIGIPVDVLERALPLLLEDGCLVEHPEGYVIRNFLRAQETRQNDAARKRASREKVRQDLGGAGLELSATQHLVTKRDQMLPAVTSGHQRSPAVTLGHSVPSLAVPRDPDTHSGREEAPVEADPEESSAPAPPSPPPSALPVQSPDEPPERPEAATAREDAPSGQLAAFVADHPADDLLALVALLAEEGDPFGCDLSTQVTQGRRLTHRQRDALGRIQSQRKDRPTGPSASSHGGSTADERALVELYVSAVRRALRRAIPVLDRDLRAAKKALPDIVSCARQAAESAAGRWSPTWQEIATHYLASYLRIGDPKLAEQGYPLALMMSRIDPADIPRRSPEQRRQRPAEEPSPPPVDRAASLAAMRALVGRLVPVTPTEEVQSEA